MTLISSPSVNPHLNDLIWPTIGVVSLDLIHILAFAKKNPLLQKLTKGDITTVNFRTMASGFSFASHVVINKMSYLIGKMNVNHENDKQSENW
jgi:hypothetical protein